MLFLNIIEIHQLDWFLWFLSNNAFFCIFLNQTVIDTKQGLLEGFLYSDKYTNAFFIKCADLRDQCNTLINIVL